MKRKLMLAAGQILSAFLFVSAAETTVTWTNTSKSATWLFGDTKNWNTAAGEIPSVAPTNGENVVFAEPPASVGGVSITTGPWSGGDSVVYLTGGASSPIVGTVTGGAKYLITHGKMEKTLIQKERRFVIGDPSGYLGYWGIGEPLCVFVVSPLADAVQRMSTILAANRPELDVAGDGTLEVAEINGRGTLAKHGRGNLTVKGTAGVDTTVVLADGGVTFEPPTSERIAELWRTAALHLDASAIETLTTSNADGYAWVTRWEDVRGTGVYAKPSGFTSKNSKTEYPWTRPGYLSVTGTSGNERAPTGLPVVSFGTSGAYMYGSLTPPGGDYTCDGPTNCEMVLSRSFTNVREAFYVARTPHTPGNSTILGTSDSTYHFMPEGGMFADYAQSDAEAGSVYRLRNGEMRFNGERRPLEDFKNATFYTAQTGYYVMGLSPAYDSTVGMLGSRNHMMYYSSGCRIGEVILFTNVLTKAERAYFNNYLKAKWLTGDTAFCTAENLIVDQTNANASVGVAQGAVASVKNVYLPAKKLVKTGAGTLEIGNLYPSNVAVTVAGGAMRFAGTTPVDDAAPADGAWMWLDAEQAETKMTTFTSGLHPGKTFVAEWRGRGADANARAVSKWGETDLTDSFASVPTLTTFNGRKVVDFGTAWDADRKDKSMMNFKATSATVPQSYSGFMAVRLLTSYLDWALFGSTAMDLYRQAYPYYHTICGTWYRQPNAANAVWTIDGAPHDGLGYNQAEIKQTSRMIVVAFSGDRKIVSDCLAYINGQPTKTTATFGGGNLQIGEVLLYDRVLTSDERMRTEAYLMNKWLGRKHPAVERKTRIASVSFGAGVDPVIDSETALEVLDVAGVGNRLVKKGGGSAQVSAIPMEGLDTISVKGGALTLDFTLSQKPGFRFDATAAGVFKTQEWRPESPEVAADDVLRTNVLAWADVSGNNVTASYQAAADWDESKRPDARKVLRAPTLQQVETRSGVVRPMVDFGATGGPNTGNKTSERYGVKDSSAMFFDKSASYREFHSIFADSMATKRQAVFTSKANTSFYRNWENGSAILRNELASAAVKNGLVRMDGETVEDPNATAIPENPHLLSFVTTSAVIVDTFAYCGDVQYSGGACYGEHMAFANPLTDAERRALEKGLMHKWFGADYSMAFASLELAEGATLNVSGEWRPASFSVAKLIGSGTVNLEKITGLAAFDFAFTAPNACESLTLNAAVSFADAVTVTVDLAGFGKVEAGTYPLVTADAVADVDLAGWTLDVVGTSNRSFALVKNGTSICLKVSKPGVLLIVR